MGETLLQGLSITGLGMGLVFLMIIALWGFMALLVRFTNHPEKAATSGEEEAPAEQNAGEQTYAAQAAAAAVAYALVAEKHTTSAKTNAGQSAWLLSGRVRQNFHTPGKGQKK